MGGFVLRTSDDVRFFLDAKQIQWLIQHLAISTRKFEQSLLLDSKIIDDRNKSDIFIRVIVVEQALWFCISVIARGAQGLAVTTLEITKIGIIVDSVLIYYFWKEKPANVESTEVVDINFTLNELILLEEDEIARNRPFLRTPLAFTSRPIWSLNLIYHYLMNILKGMRPRAPRGSKSIEKSLGRRSDDDVLPVTGVALVIAFLSTIAFMGTNFIAWNFHFPTLTERLLWRISSCGLVATTFVGMAALEILYDDHGIQTMQQKVQERRKALADTRLPDNAKWKDRLVYQFQVLALKISNNNPEKDPNLDVSPAFALGGVPMFAVYLLLRRYIVVEDIIAFRALPAGAYRTVDWWEAVPHLG